MPRSLLARPASPLPSARRERRCYAKATIIVKSNGGVIDAAKALGDARCGNTRGPARYALLLSSALRSIDTRVALTRLLLPF